jgi:dihydropyrimidinase/dihydroorotase
VGTDHLSWHKADKEVRGEKYLAVWENLPGFPNGMESMLPVLMTAGVHENRITMEELVRVASTNTAKAFGLYPRKGVLAPGSDADIVIVDPDKEATVDESFYHGQVRDWSLYWGWNMRGLATLTVVRGKVVMEGGQTIGEAGHGRFVPCRAY